MDALASALLSGGVVAAGKAWAYPVPSFDPPCAMVGYPTSVSFDMTAKRGADEATFPVWYIVGKVSDKASRDALSAALDGAAGTKRAIELSDTLGAVVSSVRVTDCVVETQVDAAEVKFLTARFDVHVIT